MWFCRLSQRSNSVVCKEDEAGVRVLLDHLRRSPPRPTERPIAWFFALVGCGSIGIFLLIAALLGCAQQTGNSGFTAYCAAHPQTGTCP